LYKCPRTGQVINADLNGAINILHIPESQGSVSRGQLTVRDRGNGLKTQPVVYRWTNGAGWVATPTSHEVMRMKAVNHEPMSHPKGNPSLMGGEEVGRLVPSDPMIDSLLVNSSMAKLYWTLEKLGRRLMRGEITVDDAVEMLRKIAFDPSYELAWSRIERDIQPKC
jgi:hypothetical protein